MFKKMYCIKSPVEKYVPKDGLGHIFKMLQSHFYCRYLLMIHTTPTFINVWDRSTAMNKNRVHMDIAYLFFFNHALPYSIAIAYFVIMTWSISLQKRGSCFCNSIRRRFCCLNWYSVVALAPVGNPYQRCVRFPCLGQTIRARGLY